MSGEGECRKRLRPWLEAKINSQTIPGLYWMDKEKTMFRVPWKHAGKQDWTPEQSILFMEWAKHTGRYREGVDERDYATWKTRLRCAFNKAPDIQEVKDMTDLDAVQPFRVYKFLPKKPTKRLPGLETQARQTDVIKTEPDDIHTYVQQNNLNSKLPHMIERLNKNGGDQAMSISGSIPSDLKSINSQDILRPEDGTAQLEKIKQEIAEGEQSMDCVDGIGSGIVGKPMYTEEMNADPASSQPNNTPQFIDLSSLQDSLPVEAQIIYNQQSPQHEGSAAASETTQWFAQASPQSIQQQQSPVLQVQRPATTDYLQLHMSPKSVVTTESNATFLMQQQTAIDVGTMRQELPSLSQEIINPIAAALNSASPLDNTLGHEINVSVRYMDRLVYDQFINNAAGCRIYHGTDADIRSLASQNVSQQLLGPPDMEQIELPPASGLFPNEGLEGYCNQLLENMERGLLLQCRDGDIYANRLCKCKVFYSTDNTGANCYDIPRETVTKIFDFNGNFKQEMEAFRNGTSSKPPSPQIYLWFGQRIQPGHPSSKVLISAILVSARAAAQQEMGDRDNSVSSMLISKSDDGDRLAGTLKKLSDIVQ